ncbi:MAG: START-like domain-containing protein [Saprospiraceae bacterium]|nr:START-like domain-containing protein [Saprospiraceae bacterium]
MDRVSFTQEFLFRASPTIIYKFLTTPDCLIRWFCDDCNIVDGTYTFEWEGEQEEATILEDIENEQLRIEWEEYQEYEEYLDYKLSRSEVTGETILEITAFCDPDEVEQEQQFWSTQMEGLRRATGG